MTDQQPQPQSQQPPQPTPVVEFLTTPAAKKAGLEHYRHIGAISVSMILQIMALSMGSTVAQLNEYFDSETADTEEQQRLLDDLTTQSKRYTQNTPNV